MAILKTYTISTDVTGGVIDAPDLNTEIANSGHITGFTGLSSTGDSLELYGDSIVDETGLDLIVQNHVAVTLEEYKQLKWDAIDYKTGQMISAGFTFDNNLFSLSTHAQSNWTNIKANKSTFVAMALFPVQISTKDNDLYMLAEVDVDNFWGAGLNVVKLAYNTGGDLKKLIRDAVDKAGVDAVVDNR